MTEKQPKGRFERALEAIDTANAEDPNRIEYGGASRPKELLHSERASVWLEVVEPDAGELLKLAVRAHHLRRWDLPRSEYPMDRAGYHAWRRELQNRHAAGAADILEAVGYTELEVSRVGELIRKRGLGRDHEAQVFEDVLCLVFLEIQLESFAMAHEADKVVEILTRTLPKMSDHAKTLTSRLSPSPAMADLIRRAIERASAG
jgi:hypothetical protein